MIAADGDSVLAAIVALQAVTTARGAAAAHVHDRAREMRTRLDRVARDGAMRRAVMVVDDSVNALSGLCAILADVGAPILAVTHDRTIDEGLRRCGASDVLTVHDYDAVPGLWRRHRPAVVVIDEHLGDHSGAALVHRLPRGPRAVLVTSHDGARESLDDAARVTQAAAIVRTDSGGWTDDLRAEVLRALDDACPPAAP